MVPVLEDLIRQQNLTRQSLTGTQAIFLYPLNALINSQQERLREWTRGFKGKIRFALYNVKPGIPNMKFRKTSSKYLNRH